MRALASTTLSILLTTAMACSTELPAEDLPSDGPGSDTDDGGEAPPGGGGEAPGGGDDGAGGGGGDDAPSEISVPVTLVPQASDAAHERINFAVPMPPGLTEDPARVRIERAGVELPAYVRPFAWHRDGSIRSVQLQVEVDVSKVRELEVIIGAEATAGGLEPVRVQDTLITADGTQGPRVHALLPTAWLLESGLIGPVPAAPSGRDEDLDAWTGVCDYARYDTERFLRDSGNRGPWLYDRPTALFRIHALTGELSPLRDALREAHIYRERIRGSGRSTRIGVPTAEDDLKYHYAQGMAIAYLLTGDERLRERAEDVATRAADLWRPRYVPGGRFWTERHAGFALLTYVWAARVSHDRRGEFLALADEAVDAYRDGQLTYPRHYTSTAARCFAYSNSGGTETCNPWLSAILADGLEEYAAERGGERAARARDSIVLLGRMLARHGRDTSGKPYDRIAGDGSFGHRDPYHEHWGETPYVIAMAWHHDGRRDDVMRSTIDELIAGLRRHGVAPHTRSFNWQCRGAPLTPLYLQ
jgi:hypothetical protein